MGRGLYFLFSPSPALISYHIICTDKRRSGIVFFPNRERRTRKKSWEGGDEQKRQSSPSDRNGKEQRGTNKDRTDSTRIKVWKREMRERKKKKKAEILR